jgi:hypothetical protein
MKKENEHNSLYEEYQDKYRKALEENNKVQIDRWLSKMYLTAVACAKNYITKYCRSHGLNIHYFDVDDKAHDSAMYLIEQHMRKGLDYKVNKLSAMIHFGTLKVMFSDKDREIKEVSWDEFTENIGEKEYE